MSNKKEFKESYKNGKISPKITAKLVESIPKRILRPMLDDEKLLSFFDKNFFFVWNV